MVQKEPEVMQVPGIVKESQSEWWSPIVLGPKPNGTMKFCIDFRGVNAISVFGAYSAPLVDELL